MHGQRIGYIRVSTLDQNPGRQLEGARVSNVFTDKASGKDTQRPQLDALLSYVREGDTTGGAQHGSLCPQPGRFASSGAAAHWPPSCGAEPMLASRRLP